MILLLEFVEKTLVASYYFDISLCSNCPLIITNYGAWGIYDKNKGFHGTLIPLFAKNYERQFLHYLLPYFDWRLR